MVPRPPCARRLTVHPCRLGAAETVRAEAEAQQVLGEGIQFHTRNAVVDVVFEPAEVQEFQFDLGGREIVGNIAQRVPLTYIPHVGIAGTEVVRNAVAQRIECVAFGIDRAEGAIVQGDGPRVVGEAVSL